VLVVPAVRCVTFIRTAPQLFYGMTLWDRVKGVAGVIACFLLPARKHKAD